MRTKFANLLKPALLIGAVMCCFSCTSRNETKTNEWVKSAKKPIVCKLYGYNMKGDKCYTLISKDNEIFNTGAVNYELPDTIK
jgi:hypothetical protein